MNITQIIFWILVLCVIIFLRYLIFSGLYHYFLRIKWREQLGNRIFQHKIKQGNMMRMEIYRSAFVSLIFAIAGIITIYCWEINLTALYPSPSDRHWIWLLLGPFLFLAGQETYYYWTHRWMHLPKVYKYVHKWHHESIETTAFTAFSFHPLEAIIQALFLPLSALLIPMQEFIFLGLLMVMTLSATINHAGVEIFPNSWSRTPFLRKLIGATHHDLHHKRANTNYGLFFTYWDEWMGTENKKYQDRIKKITKNPH